MAPLRALIPIMILGGPMRRSIVMLLSGALATAAGASAAEWHFNFNQGVAEYAVGDFRPGNSNLALYCAESGLAPGTTSVRLQREGMQPPAGTPATFITDTGRVTIRLDGEGSADWPDLARAAPFRTLWRLLATGRRLEVKYGPGAPTVFPLAGARAMLGPKPCPKQLAG